MEPRDNHRLSDGRFDRAEAGQEEKGAVTEAPEESMPIEMRVFLHPNTKNSLPAK